MDHYLVTTKVGKSKMTETHHVCSEDAESAAVAVSTSIHGCKILSVNQIGKVFGGVEFKYTIYSPSESEINNDKGFWNDVMGWGPEGTALLFTLAEIKSLQLPASVGNDARFEVFL